VTHPLIRASIPPLFLLFLVPRCFGDAASSDHFLTSLETSSRSSSTFEVVLPSSSDVLAIVYPACIAISLAAIPCFDSPLPPLRGFIWQACSTPSSCHRSVSLTSHLRHRIVHITFPAPRISGRGVIRISVQGIFFLLLPFISHCLPSSARRRCRMVYGRKNLCPLLLGCYPFPVPPTLS